MILSQNEIRTAVERGEIKFDPPLEERQWKEASVDLRLGYSFTKFNKEAATAFAVSVATGLGPIAATGLWQEKVLKERDALGKKETFVLEPEEFVLALTYERIWIPRNLIAMVEGRSTYARAGLTMHQTAPWLQPGWNGHITLEIRNSGPLRIDLSPKVDRPCQVTFFKLTSEVSEEHAYGSRATDTYQGQVKALPKKKKNLDGHVSDAVGN
jgi:dCTP deaminase